jgi:hypothetical protein
MLILQATARREHFDAWIRIPNVQRFNREYLNMRGDCILSLLSKRMQRSKPQIINFPREYYFTQGELGASRFPVFPESQKNRRGLTLFSNLHLDGPEVWPHYSVEAFFDHQMAIKGKIISWWKEKLNRDQKGKRKEKHRDR